MSPLGLAVSYKLQFPCTWKAQVRATDCSTAHSPDLCPRGTPEAVKFLIAVLRPPCSVHGGQVTWEVQGKEKLTQTPLSENSLGAESSEPWVVLTLQPYFELLQLCGPATPKALQPTLDRFIGFITRCFRTKKQSFLPVTSNMGASPSSLPPVASLPTLW